MSELCYNLVGLLGTSECTVKYQDPLILLMSVFHSNICIVICIHYPYASKARFAPVNNLAVHFAVVYVHSLSKLGTRRSWI